MNRLLATIRRDARLQFRNGFYYASLFVLVVLASMVGQLHGLNLAWLLPAFLLSNLVINGFYFVAGLLLLEKAENSVLAQLVTPLRPWEYLASKVTTLTLLGVVENLAVVALLYGLGFGLLPLAAGLALALALYVLSGFIVAMRYDSINEYLMPSVLFATAVALPSVTYLLGWDGWLLYLHPMQAPLQLLEAAFGPVEPWRVAYGLLYSALWIWLAFRWAGRDFRRFAVGAKGGR
jgi:fluoroquinolone transport system permease protein